MAVIINGNSTAIASGSSLAKFIATLQGIAQLRGVWIPKSTDTTTVLNAGPSPLTWTEANTLNLRLSSQGTQGGQLATYNGTTDTGTATDAAFPSGAAVRTMVALIKPTAVNVADNPIFGYGTASTKNAVFWELNNAKQRIGVFGANSDAATSSQVVGTVALVGVNFDGVDTFSFFQNGAADGASAAIAGISTTLAGAGGAAIADTPQPGTWLLGHKGNVTTGFFAIYAAALTVAQHGQVKTAVNTYFGTSL